MLRASGDVGGGAGRRRWAREAERRRDEGRERGDGWVQSRAWSAAHLAVATVTYCCQRYLPFPTVHCRLLTLPTDSYRYLPDGRDQAHQRRAELRRHGDSQRVLRGRGDEIAHRRLPLFEQALRGGGRASRCGGAAMLCALQDAQGGTRAPEARRVGWTCIDRTTRGSEGVWPQDVSGPARGMQFVD